MPAGTKYDFFVQSCPTQNYYCDNDVPDPGFGAFLTSGSGMENESEHPGSFFRAKNI
jgi:hypothetical protein